MKNKNVDCNNVVDPVVLNVEENTKGVLSFEDPGSGGYIAEITWFKDQTAHSSFRIVFLRLDLNGGVPLYYDEYCSRTDTCNTSTKGKLNVGTGEMTIYSVTISDEGFYYYYFYREGGSSNTGHKYEIEMNVHGK